MNQYLDYLMDDMRKGDLIKNILFCSTEYSCSMNKGVSHKYGSVPEMIGLVNPVLSCPVYFVKMMRLENRENGLNYLDSTSNHMSEGIASISGEVLKMSCMGAVEKKRFDQFEDFGFYLTIQNKYYQLVVSKSALKDNLEEDEEYVYFPKTKTLQIHSVRLTEFKTEQEAGIVHSEIFTQRLHECNEKFLVAFWNIILISKWSFDKVYLGFRILNGIMALKGVFTESVLSLPFKKVSHYFRWRDQLEIIEGFTSSLYSSAQNNTPKLVIKNITVLMSNPKQSFMEILLSFSMALKINENAEETKSVLSIRDFLKKDYTAQVFIYAKDTIFKKVEDSWGLNFDEVNCALDIMLSWISMKMLLTSRFWKSRMMSGLVSNCLMAFYLKEYKKDMSDSNPTPEAIAMGRALFGEAKRYLEDLFISSGLFQKL